MNDQEKRGEGSEAREAEVLLAETLREAGEEPPVSEAKASRFYDRLREAVRSYLARGGKAGSKANEFLFFAPDVFILLWRLTQDDRVSGKNKVLLGTAVAYYIFPLDIMPEAIFGPIGYIDDLVFGVYVLNRMLIDTDEEILREHWSGSGDVLEMIRNVLKSADGMVASDVVKAIKKMMK